MHNDSTVVIRDAKVIDGTGNPWHYGDVILRGGQVADITPPGKASGDEIVDADGHVVCPGFIDILSHSIIPLLKDGRSLSKITQGVTTEIMGEGWTPAPVAGHFTDPFAGAFDKRPLERWEKAVRSWTRFTHWLDAAAQSGVSVNIGSFLGGGTLRQIGCGWAMAHATADQLRLMKRIVAECMQDGAMGISCALIYPPDSYSTTAELIELAKVVATYGGTYITHIRSEAKGLLDGVAEAIQIGRGAGCPVEIYHLKASGNENWHLMDQAIAMIDEARAQGLDITADMYPYIASGTGLSAMVPQWASEDNKLYENLKHPETRKKIRAEMETAKDDWSVAAERVMPVGFLKPAHKSYIGKRLSEIAALRNQHPAEAAMDLLSAEGQRIFTMYFTMSDDNLAKQLRQPWITIGSDAGGTDPGAETDFVHPRGYGTFTRILGKFVREDRVIGLEEAIRKMTSAVASRLGLRNRGLLRPGYAADVVIFDPATVADRATFTNPHQLSVGIRDVWVNGIRVLDDGHHTNATPGQVVRGPGWQK